MNKGFSSRVVVAAAGCSQGSLARALKALQESRKLMQVDTPFVCERELEVVGAHVGMM